MKRILAVAAAVVTLAPLAHAGDRDFKALVRSVESGLGLHRTHIPLFGMATFFVKLGHPAGVKQLDMAIFEDTECTPDAARFETAARRALDASWTPLVRVRENKGKELTYIYVRPEGRDWRLIVANFEPDEAVMLELKVDSEELIASLENPEHASRIFGGK